MANPTEGVVNLSFTTERLSNVSIRIVDVTGKVVAETIGQHFNPGLHHLEYYIESQGFFCSYEY